MSWLVPCWGRSSPYLLRISLPIWVAGDSKRTIWDKRDTNWEHMEQTMVQWLRRKIHSFEMNLPTSKYGKGEVENQLYTDSQI